MRLISVGFDSQSHSKIPVQVMERYTWLSEGQPPIRHAGSTPALDTIFDIRFVAELAYAAEVKPTRTVPG